MCEEKYRRDCLHREIDGGDQTVVVASDIEYPSHDALLIDAVNGSAECRGNVGRRMPFDLLHDHHPASNRTTGSGMLFLPLGQQAFTRDFDAYIMYYILTEVKCLTTN